MSSLRNEIFFIPLPARGTYVSHPRPYSKPQFTARRMGVTAAYRLAHSARGKLCAEAFREEHSLRPLVLHANLLDDLTLELHKIRRKQDAEDEYGHEEPVVAPHTGLKVTFAPVTEQRTLPLRGDVVIADDAADGETVEHEPRKSRSTSRVEVSSRPRLGSPPAAASMFSCYDAKEDEDEDEGEEEESDEEDDDEENDAMPIIRSLPRVSLPLVTQRSALRPPLTTAPTMSSLFCHNDSETEDSASDSDDSIGSEEDVDTDSDEEAMSPELSLTRVCSSLFEKLPAISILVADAIRPNEKKTDSNDRRDDVADSPAAVSYTIVKDFASVVQVAKEMSIKDVTDGLALSDSKPGVKIARQLSLAVAS